MKIFKLESLMIDNIHYYVGKDGVTNISVDNEGALILFDNGTYKLYSPYYYYVAEGKWEEKQ